MSDSFTVLCYGAAQEAQLIKQWMESLSPTETRCLGRQRMVPVRNLLLSLTEKINTIEKELNDC